MSVLCIIQLRLSWSTIQAYSTETVATERQKINIFVLLLTYTCLCQPH